MDDVLGPESFGHGYSRQAVDEFIAAAAIEAERLEVLIADAAERTRRARAAIGTHRVMVAMVVETQLRLDELRRDAELESAAILERADREAEARRVRERAELDLIAIERSASSLDRGAADPISPRAD